MACAATALVAVDAQAATYRYWSYWWASGDAWTFATAGPGTSIPEDGSVEGWHFGRTALAGTATDEPGIAPQAAFARACGSVPSRRGIKRVALVIDPGLAADAPSDEQPGPLHVECAQVPLDASGYQALHSVARVRTDGGLVCGIDDYPLTECADVVDEAPEAVPSSSPTDPFVTADRGPAAEGASTSMADPVGPLPVIIGGLAIGTMLGFVWRRRKST